LIRNFPGGFSVLMAVYGKDNPALFERAVKSVMDNNLLPNQFLIVADGYLSIELEHSVGVLNEKYKNKIEWLRLPTNMGLAGALNEGLKLIRYQWVVRADADDFNLDFRFAKLASMVLLDNKLKLIGSSILEVDAKGNPLAYRNVPESEKQIRRIIKIRNPFNHMAVAYRRDAVLQCGGYPNVYLREDYALWCKMIASDMHVINTNEVLVHATAGIHMYRRRGGLKYAIAEFHMQSILVNHGLQNRFFAYILGFLRMIIFLSPNWFRAFFYLYFLRNRKLKF
jgi:glycosyltransferase involved in cell wall biosynthesis